MTPPADIDISENVLRRKGDILDILLRDRTSGRNIIWATDSYVKHGKEFQPKRQINPELVTGFYSKLIQPRAAKSLDEQRFRTKEKAEVFTPLKIVDQMNKVIDWAGTTYPAGPEVWQDYVRERKLEIACGEGPFIVSRYNPTSNTGKVIELQNRVGFLDRKLAVVSQYCHKPKQWLQWAKEAYMACYGYEWQGDNVLLARENLLYTLLDYHHHKFGRNPSVAVQKEFAEVISWNIWQMDGIKYVRPLSCKQSVRHTDEALANQIPFIAMEKPKKVMIECEGCRLNDPLKHTGVYAKIMDWESGKRVRFVDLAKQNDG